ncbi:MAG: PQQ-dependent sugar dehydrogenase, partial [Gemmatimonadetes bacterium]|nr:PQQ-dependent sugar dehydrogenase [Gemmatimonadota bacterium]
MRTVETDAGRTVVEPLASGLVHPWGMALLPDGRLLVTERAGRLRVWSADAGLSEPVPGIPEVWANGQGGLLDVAL